MKLLLVVVNKNNATPSVTKNLLRLSLLWLSCRRDQTLGEIFSAQGVLWLQSHVW